MDRGEIKANPAHKEFFKAQDLRGMRSCARPFRLARQAVRKLDDHVRFRIATTDHALPAKCSRRRYNGPVDVSRLPGLADARAGRITVASLLVAIGAQRMRDGGLDVQSLTVEEPEIRLYELLAVEDSDSAHSRYISGHW